MDLVGTVRQIGARIGVGTERTVNLDEQGALLVSQLGLKYGALARNNRIFGATFGTGTAIAPVQAVPTTAAAWSVYNGEPDGGRDLYIIQAAAHSVSGTLGLGLALLGCVSLARQTTVPTDYASSIKSSLCGGAFDSKALFDQDHTITGGTPAWMTLAARSQVSAVEVGSGLVAPVDGFMKVPPGHIAGFTVLAPVGTTALFGVSAIWAEL